MRLGKAGLLLIAALLLTTGDLEAPIPTLRDLQCLKPNNFCFDNNSKSDFRTDWKTYLWRI